MSEVKEVSSAMSGAGSFSLLKSRAAAAKKGDIFNFPLSLSRKSASAKSAPIAGMGRGLNLLKPPNPAGSCINFTMGRGTLFKNRPVLSPAASSISVDSQLIEAASSVTLATEVPSKSQNLALPVLKMRSEIIHTIRNTHVTIISGATGSGKVNI